MNKIKCYYCGKKEKHEFDDISCCFACAKLSSQERYTLWRKTTNKAFSDNMKRNKKMDKERGTEKLVDIVG